MAAALDPRGRCVECKVLNQVLNGRSQIRRLWWKRFHRQHVRPLRVDLCADDHRLRVSLSEPRAPGVCPLIKDHLFSNAISALSFSYDGEYIAIASSGSYIDIVRTTLSRFHRALIIV